MAWWLIDWKEVFADRVSNPVNPKTSFKIIEVPDVSNLRDKPYFILRGKIYIPKPNVKHGRTVLTSVDFQGKCDSVQIPHLFAKRSMRDADGDIHLRLGTRWYSLLRGTLSTSYPTESRSNLGYVETRASSKKFWKIYQPGKGIVITSESGDIFPGGDYIYKDRPYRRLETIRNFSAGGYRFVQVYSEGLFCYPLVSSNDVEDNICWNDWKQSPEWELLSDQPEVFQVNVPTQGYVYFGAMIQDGFLVLLAHCHCTGNLHLFISD